MKKVKFIQSIASDTFSYAPGSEHEIDAHLADAWIADGIATAVQDNAADLKAQIAELQSRLSQVAKDAKPADAKPAADAKK